MIILVQKVSKKEIVHKKYYHFIKS